jgi:hypothetical protein
VRERKEQLKLPGVPRAKQGREVPQKWAWTEASVWTERMLETLERGIKGGKWFSLIDKVWKTENLQSALPGQFPDAPCEHFVSLEADLSAPSTPFPSGLRSSLF